MSVKPWRLVAAIAIQLLILAAVPGRRLLAHATGTEVTLKTRPVDPYDPFSGYYVTLAYDVESTKWRNGTAPPSGTNVFVTIERGEPAWQAVDVSLTPIASTHDRISIKAIWQGRPMLVGAGRIYVPEDQRDDVARLLRERPTEPVVDMKVGADGTVAPLRLRIGGKSWGSWKEPG